eukprot:c21000_g1_i5.p1 GENE.c21000_g1_i5~~c21000_g1_i5.p1  ORF type:complete len:524 (+),score=53.68 c21000_g1_i5:58-1629(+)
MDTALRRQYNALQAMIDEKEREFYPFESWMYLDDSILQRLFPNQYYHSARALRDALAAQQQQQQVQNTPTFLFPTPPNVNWRSLTPPALPQNLQSLETFVNTPFPYHFQGRNLNYIPQLLNDVNAQKQLAISGGIIAILNFLATLTLPGEVTKETWAATYYGNVFGNFVQQIFVEMKLDYKWEKNKSSTTTNGTKRPDYIGQFGNGMVFLRGEEKPNGAITIPKDEIKSKMKDWSPHIYGFLPYVFGYAAAGKFVQIYAIHPIKEVQPITEVFDLGNALQFSNLLQCIFRIACLAPLMQEQFPPGTKSYAFHAPISRQNNKVVLKFDENQVDKFYNPPLATESLKAKYEDLKHLNCPNIPKITLVTVTNDVLQVRSEPVGLVAFPATKQQLREAILSIVIALQALHQNGYCHGDIRWPNVVLLGKKIGNGFDFHQWALIDFDTAAKNNTVPITWESHPYCNNQNPILLTFAADWYQVGELLTVGGFSDELHQIDDQRRQLKAYFQSSDFSSAEAATRVGQILK